MMTRPRHIIFLVLFVFLCITTIPYVKNEDNILDDQRLDPLNVIPAITTPITLSDPFFASIFYFMGKNAPDRLLIHLSQQILRRLNIDKMLQAENMKYWQWMTGRKRIQQGTLRMVQFTFNQLSDQQKAAWIRHIFQTIPEHKAAGIVRTVPLNGLKRTAELASTQFQNFIGTTIVAVTSICVEKDRPMVGVQELNCMEKILLL